MIYWFTGQSGSGKTTLATELKVYLESQGNKDIKLVDGDDIRELYENKDYSIKGRVYNVDIAQKISKYLHNNGSIVIVSLVSPYIDQREEFKDSLKGNIKEFYVYTSSIRGREHFHVNGYQPPKDKNFFIDTTKDTVQESLKKILLKLEKN